MMLEVLGIWAAITVYGFVVFIFGALAARKAFLRRMRAKDAANETLLRSLDESTRRLVTAARLLESVNKVLIDQFPEAATAVRHLTSKRVH
jgi:hypothetical protein